jgi:hypothetical protein
MTKRARHLFIGETFKVIVNDEEKTFGKVTWVEAGEVAGNIIIHCDNGDFETTEDAELELVTVISATDGEVVTISPEGVKREAPPEAIFSSTKNASKWLEMQCLNAFNAALSAIDQDIVGVVVIVVNRDPKAGQPDGWGRYTGRYNNLDVNTAFAVSQRAGLDFHLNTRG